ncbi:DNA replication/repair protein RecF [Falsirhodobacter algicola]|uniref:DNA replication and repair protein RecF n=1 Tax=Falsirhodobacter algicola TaxID=2692330 RepID=A0A8J8SL16_9RHOB|nr:DNA replication/repair protein RecF [Falsirhodobacter algicola]QUS35951.1 DNA replication/repair protein RecF [Falsirhodobacter algicola]
MSDDRPFAIAALRLSHFRSHRATRLALDGRPVALFGPNGAGKTNVLEAVSLLSPGRGLRRAGAEDLARRPEAIGWKITAEAAGHEIETWAEPGGARQVRIDGKAAPQVALGRVMRQVWLVPSMDRLWIEPAEGRRRFLDRMVMSFVPDHADAVLTYEKAMRERNRLLRDDVSDPAWYHALEAQMADAADAITANRHAALARVIAAQDGPFPRAELSITDDGGWPEAWIDRRRDRAAGRTLHGPHRADLQGVYAAKAMPAAQCSTGEQKALLISLILANARALSGEAPVVVLLDEVAAHLDADRRAALYAQLRDMRVQVLMTGTGAELFDSLGPDAQRIVVTEAAEGSTLAPAGPQDPE